MGGTTPHTTPLGKKGGNEKALSQARGLRKASEIQESPSGAPEVVQPVGYCRNEFGDGESRPLATLCCPRNVPASVQSSSCCTLNLGAPRNLTPVRFCLFYHYVKKKSRLSSQPGQGLVSRPGGGHAPGAAPARGERLRLPRAVVG